MKCFDLGDQIVQLVTLKIFSVHHNSLKIHIFLLKASEAALPCVKKVILRNIVFITLFDIYILYDISLTNS